MRHRFVFPSTFPVSNSAIFFKNCHTSGTHTAIGRGSESWGRPNVSIQCMLSTLDQNRCIRSRSRIGKPESGSSSNLTMSDVQPVPQNAPVYRPLLLATRRRPVIFRAKVLNSKVQKLTGLNKARALARTGDVWSVLEPELSVIAMIRSLCGLVLLPVVAAFFQGVPTSTWSMSRRISEATTSYPRSHQGFPNCPAAYQKYRSRAPCHPSTNF